MPTNRVYKVRESKIRLTTSSPNHALKIWRCYVLRDNPYTVHDVRFSKSSWLNGAGRLPAPRHPRMYPMHAVLGIYEWVRWQGQWQAVSRLIARSLSRRDSIDYISALQDSELDKARQTHRTPCGSQCLMVPCGMAWCRQRRPAILPTHANGLCSVPKLYQPEQNIQARSVVPHFDSLTIVVHSRVGASLSPIVACIWSNTLETNPSHVGRRP